MPTQQQIEVARVIATIEFLDACLENGATKEQAGIELKRNVDTVAKRAIWWLDQAMNA